MIYIYINVSRWTIKLILNLEYVNYILYTTVYMSMYVSAYRCDVHIGHHTLVSYASSDRIQKMLKLVFLVSHLAPHRMGYLSQTFSCDTCLTMLDSFSKHLAIDPKKNS